MSNLFGSKHLKALRDNYRPAFGVAVLLLLSFMGNAQVFPPPSTSYGTRINRVAIDSVLYGPTGCGAPTDSNFLFSQGFGQGQKLRKFALYYDSCGHHEYVWDPNLQAWHMTDSAGGGNSDSGFQVLNASLTGGVPIAKYVDGSGHRFVLYDTAASHPGAIGTNAGIQKKIDSLNAVIGGLLSTKFGLSDTGYTHLLASVYTLRKVTDSLGAILAGKQAAGSYLTAPVANASLASMSANTIKGVTSAGAPADLTVSQVQSLLGLIINGGGASKITVGLASARPTASNCQCFFVATDALTWSYDNGSWITIGGGSSCGSCVTNSGGVNILWAGLYSALPAASTGPGLAYTTDSGFYYSNGTAWTKNAFNLYFHNSGGRGDGLVSTPNSNTVAFPKLIDSVGLCFHHVMNADSTWTLYVDSACVITWAHMRKVLDSLNGVYLTIANNLSDVANAGTARTNLGLGTAATHDVPATGNASSTQVVLGSDTRLGSGGSISLTTTPTSGPSPTYGLGTLNIDTFRYAHIFNVVDYGAKGDGLDITGAGSITSSANILTDANATFSASDVGKYIMVYGAGAAGVNLVTTISGFTSTHVVTLTANAGTTVTTAEIVYGTPNGAAIQAAINAAYAYGGGVVYFPIYSTGTYLLPDTLQLITAQGFAVNSQLYIPQDSVAKSVKRTAIKFMGEVPPNTFPNEGVIGRSPLTSRGIILRSMITGTGSIPSIVSGPYVADGFLGFGVTDFYMENISLEVYTNNGSVAPTMGAFNGIDIGKITLKNCTASIDALLQNSTSPVNYETFGFIVGKLDNNGPNIIQECSATGFKYGFVPGDHTQFIKSISFGNYAGVAMPHNDYGVTGDLILHWNTIPILAPNTTGGFLNGATNLVGTSNIYFNVDNEVFDSATRWYAGHGYPRIADTLNYLHGLVRIQSAISITDVDESKNLPVYGAGNVAVQPYELNGWWIGQKEQFAITPLGAFMPYNTSNADMSIGSLRFQGFHLNDGFIGDNIHFASPSYIRDSTGYGSGFEIYNGGIYAKGGPSGAAGTIIPLTNFQSLNLDGSGGMGGTGGAPFGSSGYALNWGTTGNFGLGTAYSSTSRLSIAAPTSSLSSINLAPGTFPTSPVQGDLGPATGHLYYRDGSTTYDLLHPATSASGSLWSQTSSGTALTNSTTQTSILNATGNTQGTLPTIAANTLAVGQKITMHGFATVAHSSTGGSLFIVPSVGSGSQNISIGAPATSNLGSAMEITAEYTITSTGTSGTAYATLKIIDGSTGLTTLSTFGSITIGNTAASMTMDLQVQWGSATTGDSIQTLPNFTVKIE